MKISGIDNLDVGMSNIEIEGKVTYEKAPRHIEGDNERGHYDFYSQFVVIDDSTGKIGCNVSMEKETYRLEKGVMARVKGKLEQYKDKNGEMQKSLKCSLVGISKGGKETDVQLEVAEEYFDEKAREAKEEKPAPIEKPTEKPSNNVWEAKDLRIARECAVKAVTELICAKIMKSKDFFDFADTIVKYIYNGLTKKPKGKVTKADRIKLAKNIIKEHGSVEVKDEDAPFPDEDEPGSSYDNAKPYKGKKKALKKVSSADDFISNEELPDDYEGLPE